MAEELSPGSPLWWLAKLEFRLRQRALRIKKYDDYYEGEHNLMFATQKFKDVFGDLLATLADNWVELVVDSLVERIKPQGFRWGEDVPYDKEAWDIWQANHMDAESQILFTEAVICEESYVLVNPFTDPEKTPELTVEHPLQVMVAHEPGSRWKRQAALKMWTDDYGASFATVYMPDRIWKYKATQMVPDVGAPSIILPPGVAIAKWIPREVPGEDWPLVNPLGVVPIVRFLNRPRALKTGRSDVATVISNQDAVNKLLADMMVASEIAAFRQRVLSGHELEEDPVTGELKQPFQSGIERLFVLEDKDAKMYDLEATDLSNYVNAIKNRIESIAAQTRVPAHYFGLIGQWPSGEALKSAEAGLVSRVRGKLLFFGEALEEVIRLAFRVKRDDRGDDLSSETIWSDPESRTESQMVDAAVKLKDIGVANELLQERIGMTPQQISRNKRLLAVEALDVAQALNPFVPKAEPSGNGNEPAPESVPAS